VGHLQHAVNIVRVRTLALAVSVAGIVPLLVAAQ
jgi:hypothetical protein